MRFGVRIGPFYASTSTRRRRPDKEPSFGCAVTLMCLAVVWSLVFAVPAQWRWWTLGGIALFALITAMVVSTRNDAAKARAAERQKATDFAAGACVPGDRLRFVSGRYAQRYQPALSPGDLGTFTSRDDSGFLQVKWDNGSQYELHPMLDRFELVEEPEQPGGEADAPETVPGRDQGT